MEHWRVHLVMRFPTKFWHIYLDNVGKVLREILTFNEPKLALVNDHALSVGAGCKGTWRWRHLLPLSARFSGGMWVSTAHIYPHSTVPGTVSHYARMCSSENPRKGQPRSGALLESCCNWGALSSSKWRIPIMKTVIWMRMSNAYSFDFVKCGSTNYGLVIFLLWQKT